jgi:hypothetical protein
MNIISGKPPTVSKKRAEGLTGTHSGSNIFEDIFPSATDKPSSSGV